MSDAELMVGLLNAATNMAGMIILAYIMLRGLPLIERCIGKDDDDD